jgi:hypothetical protein
VAKCCMGQRGRCRVCGLISLTPVQVRRLWEIGLVRGHSCSVIVGRGRSRRVNRTPDDLGELWPGSEGRAQAPEAAGLTIDSDVLKWSVVFPIRDC